MARKLRNHYLLTFANFDPDLELTIQTTLDDTSMKDLVQEYPKCKPYVERLCLTPDLRFFTCGRTLQARVTPNDQFCKKSAEGIRS